MFKVLLASLFLSASAFAANRTIILRTDNMLLFRGEVSISSVQHAQEKLVELLVKRKKSEMIYIVMDSPGGDVQAGEDFIQFTKNFKNVQTITLFAASMASAIVEGLPGRRLVAENGTLMFHRAQGGFQGQFETGEVEKRLAYAKQIILAMEWRNASRLQQSLMEYKANVKDEMWIYGANNLILRTADEVVDIACSRQLVDGTTISTMSIMGIMEVQVEYSACPLIRGIKSIKQDSETKEALQKYEDTYRQGGVLRLR